jgi:hypothetical protein
MSWVAHLLNFAVLMEYIVQEVLLCFDPNTFLLARKCQLVYRGPSAGLGSILQLCQLVFSLSRLLFFYSSI